MANPMPSQLSEDISESTDDRVAPLSFKRCVKSFEAEATALSRGFKTALFIQQFKSGLLRVDDKKDLRIH